MSDRNRSLIDIALAISDGAPIDWADTPATDKSESDTQVLWHLRVIAEIVALHQRLEPSPHLSVVDELNITRPVDVRESLPSWGPLRLIAPVGHGAFGEVYRAWDPRLDREVALKLLRRRESQRTAASALIEEGRLLAKIRHPNVITVYGAERIGDHVGIWMEFIDGPTLAQVVDKEGPLPTEAVIRIGRELAGALDAVHRAGLLHRDIKAQNVMRDRDGRVVLMDFGAGQAADASVSRVAGTPLYVAPEILAGAAATPQSDIYSLGVLLHHLCTGKFPVYGRTIDEIRQIHASGGAARLREVRPDLTDTLLRIVDRATEFDPTARFESARAMEAALAESMPPARTITTRRMPIVAAGAVLAAFVVAWSLGLPLRQRDDEAGQTDRAASSIVTRRISADAGIDGLSSVSSSGRYIADFDYENGDLALLDLQTGQRRPLTGKTSAQSADYAESSAFSFDDQQIAYVWWNDGAGSYEIRLISSAGGEPRVLYRPGEVEYIAAIDWLPDASGVVASMRGDDGNAQIAVIPVSAGPVRILKRDLSRTPSRIAVSPDGRSVAFAAPAQRDLVARDIYLLSIDGRGETPLVEHPSDDFVIGWAPDGSRLLFGTDRTTGNPSIWSIAVVDGKPAGVPELLRPDIGRSSPLRITRNGSYFYYLPISMEDVHVGTLDGTMSRVEVPPAPIATSFVGANRWPDWSPDGRQIAYVAQSRVAARRAALALTIQSLERGIPRQLDLPLAELLRIRWSPDGRSILAAGRDHQGRGGIYQVNVQTGATTQIVGPISGLPRQVEWAANQKSIYYSVVGTTAGVVRLDLETRTKTDVQPGMFGFALSPDGRWFVGNVDDEPSGASTLILAPVGGAASRELARHEGSGAFTYGCAWASDSLRMLCVRRTASTDARELWRFSIDGAPAQRVFAAPDIRHMRLHPDGRRFAYVAGTFKAEIWAMENLLSPRAASITPTPGPAEAAVVRQTEPPLEPGSKDARASSPPMPSMVLRQIPFAPGDLNYSGGPSPDGRYVAFSDATTGDLTVLDLTSGRKRAVTDKRSWKTSAEMMRTASFSPNGHQIAYGWHLSPSAVDLRVINVDGSNRRVIYTDARTEHIEVYEWTPDARRVLTGMWRNDGTCQIALVSVSDGSVRVLKTFAREQAWKASLSPDGRYVAYDRRVSDSPQHDIFLLDADGVRETPLVEHAANDVAPVWTRDGRAVVFLSDRSTGMMGVWMVTMADGTATSSPELVKREIGQAWPKGMSDDGSYYFELAASKTDVYLASIDPAGSARSTEPSEVSTQFVGRNDSPEWSPDGDYLAYISQRTALRSGVGSKRLVVRRVATGEERELSPELNVFLSLRWSPDGRSLLTRGSDARGQWGVHQIDVQTGAVTTLIRERILKDCEWSADGQSIFYIRGRSIMQRDLASGKDRELYRAVAPWSIGEIALSPDGAHLGFSRTMGDDQAWTVLLSVIATFGGVARDVLTLQQPEMMSLGTWTRDGQELLVARWTGRFGRPQRELWRVPFNGGSPERFGIRMPGMRDVRLHPSLPRLAFTSGWSGIEMWVLENFLQ